LTVVACVCWRWLGLEPSVYPPTTHPKMVGLTRASGLCGLELFQHLKRTDELGGGGPPKLWWTRWAYFGGVCVPVSVCAHRLRNEGGGVSEFCRFDILMQDASMQLQYCTKCSRTFCIKNFCFLFILTVSGGQVTFKK
jgi:hypothetical protein